MEENIKLFIFIVLFFGSIFLSQLLDAYLIKPSGVEDWWGFVIISPMIITTFVFGVLLKNIKQLFNYAFLGSIILMICMFTQVYFDPRENKEEWFAIGKGWAYSFQYFGGIFCIIFLTTTLFLGVGMLSKYLVKVLFFPNSLKETPTNESLS